jgi:hypothetical protein
MQAVVIQFKALLDIYLEYLRKTTKKVSQENRHQGRNLKLVLLNMKTTRLQRLVEIVLELLSYIPNRKAEI